MAGSHGSATQEPQGGGLAVLVVDDERNIRTTLSMYLESMGCRVTAAATAEAALEAMAEQPIELAFVDVRLGETRGHDLLTRMLALRPGLPVVLITAYATVDSAVDAIRRGAIDYLAKPFTPAQIRHLVDSVTSRRDLQRRVAQLEGRLAEEVPEADLSTASPAMQAAIETAVRAAAADAPILLRGESGTGKGVLARLIHDRSRRAAGPFVTVNCPTLSDELLASELFGHARGAFTGAVRDQEGRVESAAGGTLFLDEIGEISPGLQAKLLRFLQDRQFERVGDGKTRKADVRVVAATNRDLEADVAAGRFREDLLFRLNVVELRVPALRERGDDILHLARGFLAFFGRANGRPGLALATDAEVALRAYRWPGNVRELRNAMERAVILGSGSVVAVPSLPERITAAASAPPGPSSSRIGGELTLDELERRHVEAVMARTSSLEEAAAILGIDASTLWRKRKKYGL